jgi:hypothetical protein
LQSNLGHHLICAKFDSQSSFLDSFSTVMQSQLVQSSLIDDSPWKLPPNIYRLKDHFQEISKKQMGKLGPFQCFSVERDPYTVHNHHAPRALKAVPDVFYDSLPGMHEKMLQPSNRAKSKFPQSERFAKGIEGHDVPSSKYYPQNLVMKPKTAPIPLRLGKNSVRKREMTFNKNRLFVPPPGRYDPYDTDKYKSKGGNSTFSQESSKIVPVVSPKVREPISFRARRSCSSNDLNAFTQREIRFYSAKPQRNVFSVKTGRQVAFLAAMPRFQEPEDFFVKLEKVQKQKHRKSIQKTFKRKRPTGQRLEELSTPRNALPRIVSHHVKIFEPLPPAAPVIKKVPVN